MNKLFEPPRFSGCPLICKAANLPAFESKRAWSEWSEANCPAMIVLDSWQCAVCGLWHFWTIGAGPSGASSGTTRGGKLLEFYQAHPEELAERLKHIKFPIQHANA